MIAAWGTAKAARHLIGRRATHSPHVIVKHIARSKPVFVIVVPAVVMSKTFLIPMLVVINLGVLALPVIELAILLLLLAAILLIAAVVVILCPGNTAGES